MKLFLSLIIILTFTVSCTNSKKEVLLPFCASKYCSEKGTAELKALYKNNLVSDDTMKIHVNVVVATNQTINHFKIEDKIVALNQIFKPAQIQFKLLPKIYYKPQKFTIDEIQEDNSLRNKVTKNTEKENQINFYIVPKGEKLNGYTFVIPDTFINYFNLKCNTIFISDEAWFNQSTLAHELGHFFGLQHTFGKSPDEQTTKEKTDGSNCNEEADFICDTPADPNGKIDANCNYIGLSDKKKHGYNPFVNNYMSYYRNKCKNEFTLGQYQSMNAFANKYRSYLLIKNN